MHPSLARRLTGFLRGSSCDLLFQPWALEEAVDVLQTVVAFFHLVFDASQGEISNEDESDLPPLSVVDLNELLAMTGDAPIDLPDGARVRLADVRKAFPVDGGLTASMPYTGKPV